MMKPALRRGWRDRHTVQFGMTPAHALTVSPVDGATHGFLDLLNGTRGAPLLREAGRRMDLPEGHVDRLVDRLTRVGLLDDPHAGGSEAEGLRARPRALDRLRPDLASLTLTTSGPGEAMRLLAARRALRVRVWGAGRVGAILASLLSGAGVGEVEVRDSGRVEPWDVAPGGLPPEAVGDRREDAARRAVRSAAPDRPPRRSRTRATEGDGAPAVSLVVLAPRDDVAVHAPVPADAETLMTAGIPHLYTGVAEGTGVVGPLVLPGETGCAGCLHQHRTDQDPAWPRLVAQWISGAGQRVGPCDLALATAVAGSAAAHALGFLDGRTPSGVGTRWEVSLPGLEWRAHPVPAHPACPCGAVGGPAGEPDSVGAGGRATMAERRPSAAASPGDGGAARPTGTWRAHV